jgi:predicted unusual protein kinase regulating ubiquinone biosynthesis (AarF/ABC1/UbiB family)
MARSLPQALATLLDAAGALARRSKSAQVALARLDGVVDPGLLPTELRAGAAREIAAAVASTTKPLSAKEIKKAVGDAVDEVDPEPALVRPDSQVHHGSHDGERVTITVLRPGLAQLVRSDLSLLDVLAAPLGAVLPRLDVGRMLREIRERSLDELDLEHEASTQRRAARALRRSAVAAVAAPRTDLCSHEVLVCERVDGPLLADGPPPDPGAVARALVHVFAGAPRALGTVFADPRADEVALGPDGRITLLRLGSARDVDPGRLDAARDALAALRDDDADAFAAAVARLGVLGEDDARAVHAVASDLAGDLLRGPALLDVATVGAIADRALDRLDELFPIAQRATPDPVDLWPARMIGQLIALLASLGATEDWGALALEALGEGWS